MTGNGYSGIFLDIILKIILVTAPKRRRSIYTVVQAKDDESKSVNILKEMCSSQQSVLSAIRKEVQNLSFIVQHLNKDTACIVEFQKKGLKEAIESQLSLLDFMSTESLILQKSDLESQNEKLDAALSALHSEHKLLIEQQISSEEAMLDELAKLMTENEKLKRTNGNAPATAASNVDYLKAVVEEIEREMCHSISAADIESFTISLETKRHQLELELQQKMECLVSVEEANTGLKERIAEMETLLEHTNTTFESIISALKSELSACKSEIAVDKETITRLQNSVAAKSKEVETALAESQKSHKELAELQKLVEQLNATIIAKNEKCSELDKLVQDYSVQISAQDNDIAKLKDQLEAEQQKAVEYNSRTSELSALRLKLSTLEETHSCLLDIVKDKETSLVELQSKFDSLIKDHEENEQRVRELISSNAELLDTIENSKRIESLLSAKEEQIVTLQQALSESQKLADIRGAELERVRAEKDEIIGKLEEMTEKLANMDKIKAENAAIKAENEGLQQQLECKATSKTEVILKIEVEKLKEALNRERKLNELKVIDLEEQVENLRNELAQAKQQASSHDSCASPPSEDETENLDPFKEAKDKLALLNKKSEPLNLSSNKRVLQHQGTPPQECLQQ